MAHLIEPAPHHIPAMAFRGWPGGPGPSPIDAAGQTVRLRANQARAARSAYVDALVKLGHASRRYTSGDRPTPMQRGIAMKALNRARAECRRAELAEVSARAALAVLTAPVPFLMAAE